MVTTMFRAGAAIFGLAMIAGLPLTDCAGAEERHVARDARETVVLSTEERDRMLAGMRTYLESIQGIIASLAANQTKQVARHAAMSGKKLLGSVDPARALAVHHGYTTMSLDTHQKFDDLASKAARGTTKLELLSDLSAILANCITCHAAYRVTRR
jgi:hypothetical protein